MLTQGDWLEVRGERQGTSRSMTIDASVPDTCAQGPCAATRLTRPRRRSSGRSFEYLEDMTGAESLGIGYAALFLRAAPAGSDRARDFDAIGTMAERLARRASARTAKAGDGAIGAQLETAESYGVHFASFDKQGQTRVCYDGEAWKRVLAPRRHRLRARTRRARSVGPRVPRSRAGAERSARHDEVAGGGG